MGAGNGTGRHDTDQNTIRYLRNACWLTKATNTHLQYVIIIAFSRQQWVRERALLLHYTFIACLAVLTKFCLDTKVLISQHFAEFFREGNTKCSDEVYNKVTGIRQHNKHLFGIYRLHVSTC